MLKKRADAQNWFLAPCIYDPARQREVIQALIGEAIEKELSLDSVPIR
jgi:hypothetical protein